MSEVANPENQAPESVAGQPTPEAAPAEGTPETVAPPETRPDAPEYIAKSDEKGKNTTPFVQPDLQPCPKCSTGMLYVIGWDHKALHEVGQPIYAPNMLSGGTVQVACFVCGHGETFPLNPIEAPANPNSGA